MKIGQKVIVKTYGEMGKELRNVKNRTGIIDKIYPNFILIRFKGGYKECHFVNDLKLVKEI